MMIVIESIVSIIAYENYRKIITLIISNENFDKIEKIIKISTTILSKS